MTRLPLFALAALVLSDPAAPAQDAQDKGYPGQLPILAGAAGRVPTKQAFVLEMRRDGAMFHGGKAIDYRSLRKQMVEFAQQHPDESLKFGDRSACLGQVHLRLHPELPFEVLYRLMGLCGDAMIYRVFLGVRAKKDGPEQAFPMFLPVDAGDRRGNEWVVTVELRYARPPVDTTLLEARFARIERKPDGKGNRLLPILLLKPESNTTIASLLRVAHTARRAGFDNFGLSRRGEPDYPGWDRGAKDFQKLVAAKHKRPDSEPGIVISAVFRNSGILEDEIEEEEEVIEAEEAIEEIKRELADKKAVADRNRAPAGGDVTAKVAVSLALNWLAKHQDEDGRWDADGFMKHDGAKNPTDGGGNPIHDVGVTGLALLAFLGDGNTMRSGPHKDVVKRGIKWLRLQQGRNGLFGSNAHHDFIYDHAIATLAMCEAYGLSGYKILERYAQMGIDYLESHRNPHAVWRYQPRDNDNDISVTSWCLLAYKSAQDFGLQVNGEALKFVGGFINALTDPKTGRVGYTKRGEHSSRHPGDHATRFPATKGEALTAAGLFSRFMLGQDPKVRVVMTKAANTLLETLPKWKDDGRIDFYYWYYGSHAMYQMGGRHWKNWRRAIYPALVGHQRKDRAFAGSWDPVSAWGEDGGRVYATAMCALTLEAVKRYSRMLKR